MFLGHSYLGAKDGLQVHSSHDVRRTVKYHNSRHSRRSPFALTAISHSRLSVAASAFAGNLLVGSIFRWKAAANASWHAALPTLKTGCRGPSDRLCEMVSCLRFFCSYAPSALMMATMLSFLSRCEPLKTCFATHKLARPASSV